MAIKSILTASVLSVIGAVVSTTAFADNMVNASTFCKPGFYAGVQGGRSDTFYSPDSALAGAINQNNAGSTTATQIGSIPFFGNGTLVSTDSRFNNIAGARTDDTGIGGRLYAGYQFNPYFAVEAGYTQYAKTSSHATVVNTGFSSGSFTPANGRPVQIFTPSTDPDSTVTRYNGEITEHAIDLVAKGTLPLPYGFGLYAKAGMAYIQADNHVNARLISDTDTSTSPTTITIHNSNLGTVYTKTYQSFAPVAGVGVNYTIPNTNMSINADYTRVFTYGGIKNAKLASLGIEYKFA